MWGSCFGSNDLEDVEASRLSNEVRTHFSSHGRLAKSYSYSRRISKQALERNEGHRAEYRLRIGSNYAPEQLVFVDESACDRRTFLRDRAWALEGLRACRKQVFARGKRFHTAAGISAGASSQSPIFRSADHKFGERLQSPCGVAPPEVGLVYTQ